MPACQGSQVCCCQSPDPTAGYCQPCLLWKFLDTQRASLAQSPVESLLLSPGSWCAQSFAVSTKSLFLWGFSVLLPDPQVGKSRKVVGQVVGPRTFVTLRELPWYNCSPVCGLSARQLYSGTNGELLQEDLCLC